MPLKAYEEFAKEPLAFPIAGKVYEVPPLGYTDGIRLARIFAGDDESLTDEKPEEGWKLVLGAAFDEMVADKVPLEAVARAGFTAMTDFQYGREQAERVWESGIDPKALQAALEQATAKAQGSTPSTSTGAAKRTRSRASGTSTTSPTATKRTAARARKSASST